MNKSAKTILLVEDEAIIAMTEKKDLTSAGFNVILAFSGEEAVKIVDGNPFQVDLILMDLNLGSGIDGAEAAQIILKSHDIPIIFLSSHVEPEIVEKAEKITSYGYLIKGSDNTILFASIRMAFRLYESNKKVRQNEAALKESQEKLTYAFNLFRYFIKHARSAIAIHDRDLKYLYVSDEYLRQYNVKSRDIIGKHHYEVFPDLPEKWKEVHRLALDGIISRAEDDPYPRKDGKMEWTSWECRPWFEADGNIGGIIINTEVISERKKKQEDTGGVS